MKIQTRDINRTQQRHTAVSLILHAVNLTGTHTLRGLSHLSVLKLHTFLSSYGKYRNATSDPEFLPQ